jgi:hypothetical protein
MARARTPDRNRVGPLDSLISSIAGRILISPLNNPQGVERPPPTHVPLQGNGIEP